MDCVCGHEHLLDWLCDMYSILSIYFVNVPYHITCKFIALSCEPASCVLSPLVLFIFYKRHLCLRNVFSVPAICCLRDHGLETSHQVDLSLAQSVCDISTYN